MKTPRKGAAVEKRTPTTTTSTTTTTAAKAQKTSRLPQLTTSAATPVQTPSRTPTSRTPIVPPTQEMHPALHHPSTAKMLDEARWLGFQNMGAHTAPPKALGKPAGLGAGQATPSKIPAAATPNAPAASKPGSSSPGFEFKFRMKSPLSGLSPKSTSILKNQREAGAAANARSLFKTDEFSALADMDSKRKTAVPKGMMKRFSDVHITQFKKMDSIANHPSAFRTVQLVTTPKKSSRMDLNDPSPTPKPSNKLKRSQSKMDLTEAAPKAPTSILKRTQSKAGLTEQPSRIPPTPFKRTQSKMDLTGSSLPRAPPSMRSVPASVDGRPATQESNPFAKRVKRTEVDDAATTRPSGSDQPEAKKTEAAKTATPARKVTSQTALPRLASRLMTPTKASLMRSQSVKPLKSQSVAPSLLKAPSANIFSPANLSNAVKESVQSGIRKTSSSLQKIHSILRTPSRKFTHDPTKIAAGTHMSPPPGLDLEKELKALPPVPQTVPAKKHVVFTNSTLERDTQEVDWAKSPSPMKLRAGSEVPSGAVIYPSLSGANVEYPTLAIEGKESPSRRLTFGDSASTAPGKFSFKSDKPISFGPASTGTIRMVRKSNVSSMFDAKKRRLDTVEETSTSDKENGAPAQQEEGRSAKKARTAPTEPPKTPAKTPSKLPCGTPSKRGSSISKSRLAFLSTPKRSRA
ncbi:hypothetical protein P280DRAFT_492507 [Massarina eburnea CBS 473.64]|uniref:Uncharacterized protein n=1 Tax=Massarina eburnea CBS 473.64 TaxID=1395130 RepID=A0A6A6RPD7_9PLEO|nr:hypothetical protein P280DRAFT_492507 [Massarina eburnea CBS 473.64]